MNPQPKMVKYEDYCKKCEHKPVKDHDDPCNECLDNPVRLDGSRKPINFKEKEK